MSAEREIRQLQKAKEKAQRAGNLVEEAALCNQLGEILASHGRYEEALEEHRQELQLLEGAGDRLGCAVAHRKIGERLAELESYEEALEHQRQHLELARALGDDTEQQRAWATIGRTYMFVGESRGEEEEEEEALRKAEEAFRTSLGIVEEKLEGAVAPRELSAMRTRLYLNLGLVYEGLREAARGEHYVRKSIFLAQQGQLVEDLSRAYFNLGHMRLRAGEPSGALRCLARARDCARTLRDQAMESECCAAAGQVLLSLGDFGAAKRSLRQAYALGSRQPQQRRLVRANLRYATKVTRLQEALEEAGDDEVALSLCERLGDTFAKHGDFARALPYYQKQLSLAEALRRPPAELAVIHVSLATTCGDLGDPARALHHYRQELALRRGDALEEGKTWLNVALAMAEAGEPRAQLLPCLRTALQRARQAGEPRLQRQIQRHLRSFGDAESAAEGLEGGAEEEEEEDDDDEEEEPESSQAQEESELELSESEGEEDELDGYSKSVPGRRRINKWNRRNERGETPLHRACIEGDLRRVRLFLEQGHPVNPRDYCGWTPLHEACNHGHLEIVRLLLERGAALDDAGGPGCEGVTPLHDALSCGHFEVAELLVRRGASLAARTARGLTPLGTLEEWARTYGDELDEETRCRCRAAERMLREAMGRAPVSPVPDAESPVPAEPPDPGDPSPLRPVRKRPRAPGAQSPGPGAVPGAPPALIPAEEYLSGDDWLEDDVGQRRAGTNRKRLRRRAPSPPADLPAPPRRRRQSRLTDSLERVPAGRCRQRRDPGEAAEPPLPNEDEGSPPRPPTPSPATSPAPPATPAPVIRVRVRVQDNLFLIPVPQSERRAVGWLAERAAERYYQACGVLPRLTLKKEGALLAPQDPVGDVLQSNEEVLAEVLSWELPPLAERYRRACQSLAVEPDPLLLKVTELQEQSPAVGAGGGGLSPRPPQARPLLRALRLQAPLRELRLRSCGLGDAAAPELAATLATLPALRLLDLAGNRLGPGGLRALLGPPGSGALQSLEELDLSLNPLGDAACQPLGHLLGHCPALVTLRLRACAFARAFALPVPPRLQTLTLSCNPLGSEGLERLLGQWPRGGGHLTRLELGAVAGPAPRGLARGIGAFLLREGSALTHLTLSGNRLGDSDVLELAKCVGRCPALLSLDLSANAGVTALGLRALLGALEAAARRLRLLGLAGCSVEGPLDAATRSRVAAAVDELRLGRRLPGGL